MSDREASVQREPTPDRDAEARDPVHVPDVSQAFKVFVGGIPWQLDDYKLKDVFRDFNPLSARVMLDRATNRSRGFGFVTFETEEDMADAIEKIHQQEVDGRRISVNRAVPESTVAPGASGSSFRNGRAQPRQDDRSRGQGGRYERSGEQSGYDRGPVRSGYDRAGAERGSYERGGYARAAAGYDRGYDREYERPYVAGGGGHADAYEPPAYSPERPVYAPERYATERYAPERYAPERYAPDRPAYGSYDRGYSRGGYAGGGYASGGGGGPARDYGADYARPDYGRAEYSPAPYGREYESSRGGYEVHGTGGYAPAPRDYGRVPVYDAPPVYDERPARGYGPDRGYDRHARASGPYDRPR